MPTCETADRQALPRPHHGAIDLWPMRMPCRSGRLGPAVPHELFVESLHQRPSLAVHAHLTRGDATDLGKCECCA